MAKSASDYQKGLNETAKLGEVVQLIERRIQPADAGVRAAIVVSVLALAISIAAVSWVLVAVTKVAR